MYEARAPEHDSAAPDAAAAFAQRNGSGRPHRRHPMFNKIKRQNGEQFAQEINEYHNGLFEIPNLLDIVRYAGRDAEPLLPYLAGLQHPQRKTLKKAKAAPTQDPFTLLKKAGYNAFLADSLKKQNSIKKWFVAGELLCTFNENARYKDYYIVHAIKDDAATIKRSDKGEEQRQDAYGTSVISIQMLKEGGFIKITNRYNHTVEYADNTFNSNPDNIIEGLSAALKAHFKVDFTAPAEPLPEGYILCGNQIFDYDFEENNIYYGNQAWAQNGEIHEVDRSRYAKFDGFLFDNKTQTLQKIDATYEDSFAEDFNRDYGGNPALRVDSKGNLWLKDHMLIGAEGSRIKTLDLPALTSMSRNCLRSAPSLRYMKINGVKTMGSGSLCECPKLEHFEAHTLETIGKHCLQYANSLETCLVGNLVSMKDFSLQHIPQLTRWIANALLSMGSDCLKQAKNLTHIEMNAVTTIGSYSLYEIDNVTFLKAGSLKTMGHHCLSSASKLTHFITPMLEAIGYDCLLRNALTNVEAPLLQTIPTHLARFFTRPACNIIPAPRPFYQA